MPNSRAGPRLEERGAAQALGVDRVGVGHVHHEPALAGRNEPARPLLQLRLGDRLERHLRPTVLRNSTRQITAMTAATNGTK